MNKEFVKEEDGEGDDAKFGLPAPLHRFKNYISPAGYQRLRDELLQLIDVERPEVVRSVSCAASNGDRSENGDYIYGKRRLRQIDGRIRFLTKRMDVAEVFDPSVHHGSDQVFFGATVTYENESGDMHTVTIVGIDEFDPLHGKISWVSPVARADQGPPRRFCDTAYAVVLGRIAHTGSGISGAGKLALQPCSLSCRVPAICASRC